MAPRRVSVGLPFLERPGGYTSQLEPMTLQLDQLHGGWYCSDFSKPKTKDAPEGIWIRILKDGEMVSEFINPPALQTKVQ